jgi:ankyrin repeat protein
LLAACAIGAGSEIVHILLEGGANPNVSHWFGMTPLMQAAAKQDLGSVEALLNYGAHRDPRDDKGWTALDFAKWKRNQGCISLLEK